MKLFSRSGGILLHPTSLPGPYGMGDLGPQAYRFVDWLVETGCKLWQVLPLGPTGYADSPYQCFSAFAGNPNLISPELLAREGLLAPSDWSATKFPTDRVAYDTVIPFKAQLTARAWERFQSNRASPMRERFETFCSQQSHWLEDFALFLALKEVHGGVSWLEWSEEFIHRRPEALRRARQELANAIELHTFRQFLFFE